MVCKRCQTLMYPKPSTKKKNRKGEADNTSVPSALPAGIAIPPSAFDNVENHKRDCCADGAPVKPKDDVPDVPPWPQPQGIFTKGTTFHVLPFLLAVQLIYQKTVEEAQDIATLDAEQQAFATMFKERLLIESLDGLGHVAFFRLYAGLQIADEEAYRDYYMVKNGAKYLRLDCLRDTDSIPTTSSTGTVVAPSSDLSMPSFAAMHTTSLFDISDTVTSSDTSVLVSPTYDCPL